MATLTENITSAVTHPGSYSAPAPESAVTRRTVDVVIPCYNYARYLAGCVGSVLEQPGVDVRVLIIDDASTDDTAEVGRALAANDPRVEFRQHSVNRGHIATYNEGLLGWTTSEYVVLLSADDLLAPGSLDRAVTVMEGDQTIGLVYGRTVHFSDETELPPNPRQSYRYKKYRGYDWLKDRCRRAQNVITSPEVVVRGSIQRSIGGYRPELPHAGDLEMWMRIASVSNLGYICDAPQAFYRVHAQSMQRTSFKSSLSDFDQRKAAFDSFFIHLDRKTNNAAHLQRLACRSLASEALWDVCRAYDHNQIDPSRLNELMEFATRTYSEAASLPEYRALRRRRSLGPALCYRCQLFIVPALCRWIVRWARKWRWTRRGV